MKFTKKSVGAWLMSSAIAPSVAVGAFYAGSTASAQTGDEIVVIATRRATNLQETPLAVTAITGESIEQSRIQSVEDTLLLTPNASFINASGSSGSYATLRGTATIDDAPGVDLPVTFFIDDVFYGSAVTAYPDFFDVEQIEILRGPQGTTFGRNTTGGAIVVRSRKPEETFGGALAATVGNNERYELRGHVTGPLGGGVAGRFAFSMRDYEGYQDNVFTGGTEGGADFISARGMLAFDLGERTSALVNLNYTRDETPGPGFTFFVIGDGPSLPGFSGVTVSQDPDVTSGNVTPLSDRTNAAISAQIEHDFGAALLTSITAYRNTDTSNHVEADGLELNIQNQTEAQEETQWSQELRLTSQGEGPLEWIAGLYLLQQDNQRVETYTQDFIAGTSVFLAAPGIPAHVDQELIQDIQTTSIAPYFEGVYHFTDMFALRAGVRYTWEEKEGLTSHAGTINRIITFPVEYVAEYKQDWEAWTPRVILEFEPRENLFFYAGASKGFKSGGFTLNPLTEAAAETPYDPEYTWNYELGMRSDWFDRALRVNLTLFQQVTEDLQTRQFEAGAFRFINAGETESVGAELEIVARPTQYIDLGVSYGLIDATYTDFPRCNSSGTVNCTGNRFALVPEQTVAAFAAGRLPLGDNNGELFGRVEAQYRTDIALDAQGVTAQALVDATEINGIFNAQLGWESADGAWRATLWGKNLTDERYVNFAADLSIFYLAPSEYGAFNAFFGGTEYMYRVMYNEGRTYGLTLSREF